MAPFSTGSISVSNTVIDLRPSPTAPPFVLPPTLSNREDVSLSEKLRLPFHWEMSSYWREPIHSNKKDGLQMASLLVSGDANRHLSYFLYLYSCLFFYLLLHHFVTLAPCHLKKHFTQLYFFFSYFFYIIMYLIVPLTHFFYFAFIYR